MSARWFVVMIPGEDAESSEGFGPFRSLEAAEKVRDDWNFGPNRADEQARVMPIFPASEMRSEA